MPLTFNDRLRQILLLALIVLLGILMVSQFYQLLPGFLGAITLYILCRKWYHYLTIIKKWNKGLTAMLFIFSILIIISIPVYFSVQLVSPKINLLLSNQHVFVQGVEAFAQKVKSSTGIRLFSEENSQQIAAKISGILPSILNSTANLLTNLLMMFFLLYYLFVGGRQLESNLNRLIPLKPHNVDKLASETILMIRANAIGIPLICFVQGITAAIGYLIFGVDDWGLWGFITGVFAFFPLLGTMIIWVPLVAYLYTTGQSYSATGLLLYSALVTGNVDYVTRLSLLKKMGNVHPLITILGVILGLQLFGFMGLIFGPLLISYFLILVKIYINEFSASDVQNETEP